MTLHSTATIDAIRDASRAMVRELGFMAPTLAATDYSPSAVHALLEIERRSGMTAAQLVPFLGLDKSSVSRMVAKLIQSGELSEVAIDGDGRVKQLLLTPKGLRTVTEIHAYGRLQVTRALAHLNPSHQQAVAQGLTAYSEALRRHRLGEVASTAPMIDIAAGYQPGLIGRITEMHASFYARHAGFGQFFESQVASGVAEFAARLDHPDNRIWCARHNGRIVGSLAIDGEDLGGNQGHLRWFILDDGCRGSGTGRRLMTEAMTFCDIRGFAATQLWTFQGLDAARRLYESFGFKLTHEEPGDKWGPSVVVQQFTRAGKGT